MTKKCIKIAITMGDPAGVGPEVVVQALKIIGRRCDAAFLVIGDSGVLGRYGFKETPRVSLWDCKNVDPRIFKPGVKSRAMGRASFDYLNRAIALIKNGEVGGLVTAPISKENIRSAGFSFSGHTEFLAHEFGVKDVEMVFVSPKLKVALATRHVGLKRAIALVTKDRIIGCGRTVHALLKGYFKIRFPKIAVCGLNPHAGESGLFGGEELKTIAPAIRALNKSLGPGFFGPIPADTVFHRACLGEFDCVVAMYHDQGLIPFKMAAFACGVNLTAGLPFIRTSPVHGTAFDIAGRNKADSSSFEEALLLAYRLINPNFVLGKICPKGRPSKSQWI